MEEMPALSKGKHIDDLPPECLGQILGASGLSVVDRLHCARVSRHWRWAIGEFGWTDQRVFDRNTVFEGVSDEKSETFSQRFWEIATPEGGCHLVSLLDRIISGPFNYLAELDLHSFGPQNVQPFVPRIAAALQSFQKLERLGIQDFDLADFVDFLPPSLRRLELSESVQNGVPHVFPGARISPQTLETLSRKCPNLEKVPFNAVEGMSLDTVINVYLPRFPRQKVFDMRHISDRSVPKPPGSLASIGQLRELEQLFLMGCDGLDGRSLGAIVAGCPRLRYLSLNTEFGLTERALLQLAKLPRLTVLRVDDRFGRGGRAAFTDVVLKGVAQHGQLKWVQILGPEDDPAEAPPPNGNFEEEGEEPVPTGITDDSILYLVDRCKSLVSLDLMWCWEVTERSQDAVIAEVHRRHGSPPRALPVDHRDPGVFYFTVNGSEWDHQKSEALIADIPWMKFMLVDQRNII